LGKIVLNYLIVPIQAAHF